MTDEELKKIYFPIAECWKLIRKYSDATGTPIECYKLQQEAQEIYEKSGKTEFAKDVVSATVNEIDRIMKENKEIEI